MIEKDGVRGEAPTDLPETLSFLAGLRVKTRRVPYDCPTRYLVYSVDIGQRRVAVVWRTTSGWHHAEFE